MSRWAAGIIVAVCAGVAISATARETAAGAADAAIVPEAATRAVAPAAAADDVIVGRALFRRLWVPAPTRTDAADGLGPLFNARSCAACHLQSGPSLVRKAEDGVDVVNGAVFRIAGPNGRPHPWYGRQIQTHAVPGLAPEGEARLVLVPGSGVRSQIRLTGPEPGPDYRIGVRAAPALAGRGGLDSIDERAVTARAAPDVQARLGLSGRARLVKSADGVERLGRFGWKAAQADLQSQVAEAFAVDLGLSSPLRPFPYGDCTPAQTDCWAKPNGESPAFDNREVSAAMIRMVAAYVSSLPPQAKPDAAGAALLTSTGCAACHVPALPGRDGLPVEAFTDLLLHDMGRELDDGVDEPGARSAEWRTAPLIDLASRGGRRRYLHDGRAGSIEEAIRSHGGEAAAARDAFAASSASARQQLLQYLESR